MGRLARNLTDLRLLVRNLIDRGVAVQFIKESLTFTGEDSPMANLLLSMIVWAAGQPVMYDNRPLYS
jgi:DNA invertase Pin-like site-specific DNA recombinase